MSVISVDEIERDLMDYIKRVEGGETFVIVRADKPVVEIKPVASDTRRLRSFGLCAGEFVVPDNFGEPLPEEVINLFEGR